MLVIPTLYIRGKGPVSDIPGDPGSQMPYQELGLGLGLGEFIVDIFCKFRHTLKKFIIELNDNLSDPNAKAWGPAFTPFKNSGDGLSLQPKESVKNGARSSKGQADGGSGRRSRLKRTPQRAGRGGEQLREIVRR